MAKVAKESNLKVGRPKSKRPYRKNLIRVGAMEDTLERIIARLDSDSPSFEIVKEELTNLRVKENQKYIKKIFKAES